MMTIMFGMVLPWLLIATGSWLGYQLVRQNGRILLRLDAIEKQLRPRAEAKPQNPGGPFEALTRHPARSAEHFTQERTHAHLT